MPLLANEVLVISAFAVFRKQNQEDNVEDMYKA